MKTLFKSMIACLLIASQALLSSHVVAEEDKKSAQLTLLVFEGHKPVKDFQVWVGKQVNLDKVSSNENGAAIFTMPAGKHQIGVARAGYDSSLVNLHLVENEKIQVIVTQYPGNPVPHVSIESSQDGKIKKKAANHKVVGKPGTLKGRIVNSENGEGVQGAKIFFAGYAQDFETDGGGYFEAKVPSSTYSISILHNRFASQTLDGIQIVENKTVDKKFEVTPAGIALKEFVVVAPFIQGSVSSLADERKETKVVSDFVGAEQMSKSGDSDAAAALTRVAGLTLVDGKYAVIRGMGDRYTTVLMNGAVMPSADPSSASVDLGMFPASILDSIEVQKTYSADAPGAFGGGLIKLRTKTLPEDDYFKIKISTGGNTSYTGKDVISHNGGGTDYLGLDDGDRDKPVKSNPDEVLSEIDAKKFAVNYQTKDESASPNIAGSIAFGQLSNVWGMKAGYQTYLGYSNKWSYKEGEDNTYSARGDELTLSNDFDYKKSKYNVDVTGLLTAAVQSDRFELKSTTALIRESYRLTSEKEGLNTETDVYSRSYELEWSERQLFSQQFNGEHQLFNSLLADWFLGFSTVELNNPDRIAYRYNDEESDSRSDLYYADGRTSRSFLELSDESTSLGVNLAWNASPFSWLDTKIKGGYSFDSTERTSNIIDYEIDWFNTVSIPTDIINNSNPNEILGPDNIGDAGFIFTDFTSPSDSYDATRETTGLYAVLETTWFKDLDIIVGIRNEEFIQNVNTADAIGGDAIKVNQTTSNTLPSILGTYRMLDNIQFRVAIAETVNRPSMLELSSSLWFDPESGDTIRGNPRLVESVISHFDARFEFYGNGSDSISFAYFNKEFQDPIERTFKPSVDDIVTFQNAVSATNSGFEFDFRYDLSFIPTGSFLLGMSGNYSIIDSEVVLKDGHTEYSDIRAMQGQSPYTMNLMFTIDNDELGLESAIVFNEIGERIAEVSQGDVPHVYEEPFKALDFTLKKDLDPGAIGIKVKNLLDSERLYTQNGLVSKKYNPGTSVSLSYSTSF